jgi:hypothetical protein
MKRRLHHVRRASSLVMRLAAARRAGLVLKIDVRHRKAVRILDDEAGVEQIGDGVSGRGNGRDQ